MSKKKCAIEGCFAGVNSASYELGSYNQEKLKICGKHKSFFDGHPRASDEAILSRCGECSTGICLDSENECISCNDKAFHVTSANIDKFIKTMAPIYKKLDIFNEDVKMTMDDVNKTLLLFLSTEEDLDAAFDRMQVSFLKKEERVAVPLEKTRRPTLNLLAQEAQNTAMQLATKRLLAKVQDQLPKLINMLGLTEDKAAKLNSFILSNWGSIILAGALATGATFIPLPEKYEEIGSKVAEQLRAHTMELVGNTGIDIIGMLFSSGIVSDLKQHVDEFKAATVAVPVEIAHEIHA